jgi:hypothetical protein
LKSAVKKIQIIDVDQGRLVDLRSVGKVRSEEKGVATSQGGSEIH